MKLNTPIFSFILLNLLWVTNDLKATHNKIHEKQLVAEENKNQPARPQNARLQPHPAQQEARAVNVAHTPSMSRAVQVAERPDIPRNSPASPSVASYYATPSMSRINSMNQFRQQRLGFNGNPANQAALRNQFRQYIQQSNQRRMQKLPNQRQQNINAFIAQHQQVNRQVVSNARNRIRETHPDYPNWFNSNFFAQHNYSPVYGQQNGNWWRGARWYGLNQWLALGWGYPIYYDEGGYPIDLSQDMGAYPPPPPGPFYEDYSQAEADDGPMPFAAGNIPQQGNWFPLGVFAAGQNVTQAAYSNVFLQLAVDREGNVGGTYYNAATDQTYPLTGLIEGETQQIFWKLADYPNSPLMWTGIYNLTEDVTAIQVHFPNGTEQEWTLVRLTR